MFELEITTEASFFLTSQAGAMLAMAPKDLSNTPIRRVDHHAEIARECYVELTTLERTSTECSRHNEGPQASHSGLLEPRGTSTVRKAPGVRDKTTWSVMP